MTSDFGEFGPLAVLRRTLREVLDSGYTDCTNRREIPDSACPCPSHVEARRVWAMAENVLAGTADGGLSGR